MLFSFKDIKIYITLQRAKYPRFCIFIYLLTIGTLIGYYLSPYWRGLLKTSTSILNYQFPHWAESNTIGWFILTVFLFICERLCWAILKAIVNRGKHKSINVLKPSIKICSFKKILSKAELKENFTRTPECKIKKNGYLVEGVRTIYIDYKNPRSTLTITASFKAKESNEEYKNWYYGIAIRWGKDRNKATVFQANSDDRIVLSAHGNQSLEYLAERSFSDRYVKLTAYISYTDNKIISSFYLDDILIFMDEKDKHPSPYLASIKVGSKNDQKYKVRIKNIWIGGLG